MTCYWWGCVLFEVRSFLVQWKRGVQDIVFTCLIIVLIVFRTWRWFPYTTLTYIYSQNLLNFIFWIEESVKFLMHRAIKTKWFFIIFFAWWCFSAVYIICIRRRHIIAVASIIQLFRFLRGRWTCVFSSSNIVSMLTNFIQYDVKQIVDNCWFSAWHECKITENKE